MPFANKGDRHAWISPETVKNAKLMLREGRTMDQAADACGVLRRDLDLALRKWIGQDPVRRRQPLEEGW